jgi:hypothetical protein
VGLLLLIILGFSCVSAYLLTRTRQAQKESESIKTQWSDVSEKMFTSYRQIGFMQFLQAWREGKDAEAKLMASFLGDGSKERTAALFLLNPKSLSEKEARFRQSLPDPSGWFADFVVGEQHLRNGYQEAGLEAYKRSFQSILQLPINDQSAFDKLLIEQVKARLYELTSTSEVSNNKTATVREDQDR